MTKLIDIWKLSIVGKVDLLRIVHHDQHGLLMIIVGKVDLYGTFTD